jgi:hypothetical protein
MQPGQRFSEAKVRAIKQALMRGVHPRVLARLEGVSANTMWRIKNGETYNHVKVEGEDAMRPPLDFVDYKPEGEQFEVRRDVMPLPPATMSDEEAEAMAQRLIHGNVPLGDRDKRLAEMDEETRERAKRFLGE